MTENLLVNGNKLAAEKLRRLAWPYFSDYPHIRSAIEDLRGSEEFNTRIQSFTSAITRVNELLNADEIPEEYVHLKRFKQVYKERQIPSLEDAFRDKDNFQVAAKMAFDHAAKEYPGWADAEYDSEFTPAIGIFLMGYGYYLGLRSEKTGQVSDAEEIGKSFDHGLEEVLVIEFPRSPILDDVGDWILDERNEFSDVVIVRLEEIRKDHDGN